MVAAIFLAYHARILRRDLQLTAPPTAPPAEVSEESVVGLALVRAAGRQHWLTLQRDLPARLPPGMTIEVQEVDSETAERIWTSLKRGATGPGTHAG